MRLIDADALRKEIHMLYSDDLGIREVIDKAPTAYDVEKVVREVKEIGKSYCVSVRCNEECDNCEHVAIMRSLLKVVSNGGKE